MAKLLTLVGLFATTLGAAAPSTLVVTPGPGLPSLESLNLTSADLFNPDFIRSRSLALRSLDKRFPNFCEYNDVPYPGISAIDACANYLTALGTTPCTADGIGTVMCQAYDPNTGSHATVRGTSAVSPNSASSYCSDVALAVWWTRWYCQRDLDTCYRGIAAANGNGDLRITTAY